MIATTGCDLSPRNLHGIASHAAAHVIRPATLLSKSARMVCGLFCLALSASVAAQTHFCIGGDVDHMNAAEIKSCQAKMSGVREAVKQQGAPADWHFVVVCDEAGWKEYASFTRNDPGLLSDASYSTDPRLHWTFLRGSGLNADQPQGTAAMVSMALQSVPTQKVKPQLSPSERSRSYSIAMEKHTGAESLGR